MRRERSHRPPPDPTRMRTLARIPRRLHRYPISKQGTRSGRRPVQGFRQQHGRTGHAMDWRTHSDGRRNRRNNRVDNRNRWIVAEEGGDVPQKNNTAIGHDLVQGFPFVRRNHQKQEESWPSLDYKKICHVCSMTISTARQPL